MLTRPVFFLTPVIFSGGFLSAQTEVIVHASDVQAGDRFGWSVSVDGATAVIGAVYEDGGAGDPASNAGAAYVYFGGPVPVELSTFLVE